jgi:hypothetical protein
MSINDDFRDTIVPTMITPSVKLSSLNSERQFYHWETDHANPCVFFSVFGHTVIDRGWQLCLVGRVGSRIAERKHDNKFVLFESQNVE